MAKSEVIKIIRKFIAMLQTQGVPVERTILYGSYAKGKARPDSDIDVAVVSKEFGRDRVEEGMALFRIAGKIDSRLEPVPISSESFRKDTWIPLVYEIRRHGIEVKATSK